MFIKLKQTKQGGYGSNFYEKYRGLLIWLLRHPVLTIIGTLIIFFASLQLTGFIPAIFFPANDKPVISAELKFPVGTPLLQAIGGFVPRNSW